MTGHGGTAPSGNAPTQLPQSIFAGKGFGVLDHLRRGGLAHIHVRVPTAMRGADLIRRQQQRRRRHTRRNVTHRPPSQPCWRACCCSTVCPRSSSGGATSSAASAARGRSDRRSSGRSRSSPPPTCRSSSAADGWWGRWPSSPPPLRACRCPTLRAGWRHDLATGHRLRTHRDVAGRGAHLPGPIPAGHPADLARGDDGLRVW
jgi:hypothetical protein